jgi:hypothetical protein
MNTTSAICIQNMYFCFLNYCPFHSAAAPLHMKLSKRRGTHLQTFSLTLNAKQFSVLQCHILLKVGLQHPYLLVLSWFAILMFINLTVLVRDVATCTSGYFCQTTAPTGKVFYRFFFNLSYAFMQLGIKAISYIFFKTIVCAKSQGPNCLSDLVPCKSFHDTKQVFKFVSLIQLCNN